MPSVRQYTLKTTRLDYHAKHVYSGRIETPMSRLAAQAAEAAGQGAEYAKETLADIALVMQKYVRRSCRSKLLPPIFQRFFRHVADAQKFKQVRRRLPRCDTYTLAEGACLGR